MKFNTLNRRKQLAPRGWPYWQPVGKGKALGFHRTSVGGSWRARYRTSDGKQQFTALAGDLTFVVGIVRGGLWRCHHLGRPRPDMVIHYFQAVQGAEAPGTVNTGFAFHASVHFRQLRTLASSSRGHSWATFLGGFTVVLNGALTDQSRSSGRRQAASWQCIEGVQFESSYQ